MSRRSDVGLPPFERTTCACQQCVACCARPAHLAPGDAERIATHLGVTIDDVIGLLKPGRGALIGDSATGRVARVLTIVPRTSGDRCVLLGDDDRYRVHPAAPFGCAYFDIHMGAREGESRSFWGLIDILNSQPYSDLLARVRLAAQEDDV